MSYTITPQETQQCLRKLSSFSILNQKIADVDVMKVTAEAINDMGADIGDLKRAVLYILKTGGPFYGSDNLTQIVMQAIRDTGGEREQTERQHERCVVGPRNCVGGRLFLVLEDKTETVVACPFCARGKTIPRFERYIEDQRSWAGETYEQHMAMIERAVDDMRRRLEAGEFETVWEVVQKKGVEVDGLVKGIGVIV
jgi:hypothetical protein